MNKKDVIARSPTKSGDVAISLNEHLAFRTRLPRARSLPRLRASSTSTTETNASWPASTPTLNEKRAKGTSALPRSIGARPLSSLPSRLMERYKSGR